jgi:Ca-activated chloride channel family protein
VRPVRVLGREARISGQTATVMINHLYSDYEKRLILEVEAPAEKADRVLELATVNVTYDNMKTKNTDKLANVVSVRFTKSEDEVEKNINPVVAVDTIELIATGQNELAVKLRDKGKIAEARQVLIQNEAFLNDNADRYNSQKLKDYGYQNKVDSENLDEKNWVNQRKQMRETQDWNMFE